MRKASVSFAKIRLGILLTIMGVLLVAWGVSTVQVIGLEKELRVLADDIVADLYRPGDEDTVEMAEPVVLASVEYIFFGKTVGKVVLYMRDSDSSAVAVEDDGHGHAHNSSDVYGVEYHLEKVDGSWRKTESSRCGSEQCATEGVKAFDRGLYLALTEE